MCSKSIHANISRSLKAGGPLKTGSLSLNILCLLNIERNNWGCAPSRAFREGVPPELPTPNTAEPLSRLPDFFLTFFLYRHHRHASAPFAIIVRECSVEKCARFQRRTQNPPQTIFGGSLINE